MKNIKKINTISIIEQVSSANLLEKEYDNCTIGITEDERVGYNGLRILLTLNTILRKEFAIEIEVGEMDEHAIHLMVMNCFRILCLGTQERNTNNTFSPIICNDYNYLLNVFEGLEDNSISEFRDIVIY